MFTKLRMNLESNDQPPYRSGEWLTPLYKNLLWRLELIVKDPPIEKLDADALWSKSTGGGTITEKHGKTQGRLQQALMNHCHWKSQKDSCGKRFQEMKTFTDVILCLPHHVYQDAVIHEQGRLNDLLDNLAWHHERDFQDSLLEGRKPRYLARPDPQLEDHNIAFLFGPSVYIPDPEEPAFQVLLSLDGRLVELPSLEFWRDQQSHRLPISFYAGQECLLLVPEQGEGMISIPGWQAPNEKTYLLLRRVGEKWDAFLWDSSRYIPNAPKRTSAGIWYFTIPLNDHQTLVLEIAPQPEVAATQHNASYTVIPGLPDPVSPYALVLEVVGLPTLFRNQQQYLRQWTLWLDPDGGFASPAAIMGKQQKQLAHLSLNQNGLLFTDEAGVSTPLGERINNQQEITLSAATITVLPSPADLSHFVGLLKLPLPDCYPVSENFTTIGRFDPNNPDNSPDISLNQLDQPNTVIGQGFAQETTLNSIGLSRRHAQVRVIGECLEAKLENPKNRLYRLNDQDQRSGELTGSNSSDPILLKLGESLVVGNFILRFEKTDS
ncbi:MAG: hypothetical protein WAV07_18260 [Candidatus Contendobacter sp.]